MIGVDVTDLSNAFTKHSVESYIGRILNPEETDYCKSRVDLARLWTIKESVYKWAYRMTGYHSFNPKKIKITCLNSESNTFIAEVEDHILHGWSMNELDNTYSIATDPSIQWNDLRVFHSTNQDVDRKEKAYFKDVLAIDPIFLKNENEKFDIAINGVGKELPYSRSHHGKYYFSAIIYK